jgi:hypothetical protein
VYEDTGRLIGQRILPLDGLQAGECINFSAWDNNTLFDLICVQLLCFILFVSSHPSLSHVKGSNSSTFDV